MDATWGHLAFPEETGSWKIVSCDIKAPEQVGTVIKSDYAKKQARFGSQLGFC